MIVEKGRQGRLENEFMEFFVMENDWSLDRYEGLMATHTVLSRNFYRETKIISVYLNEELLNQLLIKPLLLNLTKLVILC